MGAHHFLVPRFLLESLRFCVVWLNNGKAINPSDRISRFVFDERQLKTTQAFRAFIPPSKRPIELSVSVSSEAEGDHLWALGDRAGKDRGERALAVRHTDAPSISNCADSLSAVNKVPPRRHGNIVGWPDAGEVAKEARKTIAMALDRIASLEHRSMR
jgi:hypothetical protein